MAVSANMSDLPPTPATLANRQLRFAIAHAGTVLGRTKTVILLKVWLQMLEDDHSAESQTMDQLHQERSEDAEIRPVPDTPAL